LSPLGEASSLEATFFFARGAPNVAIEMAENASAQPARLDRLRNFLEKDPDNLQLIADAASAALDEGKAGTAMALLDRYSELKPLTPELVNLQGLAALGDGRWDDAAASFERLLADDRDEPAIRLNLAWARSGAGDSEGALAMIDDAVLAIGPAAATLKVQLLHDLERLDEALESGAVLAELYPAAQELMGALASVALDAERLDLAGSYAARAGRSQDGTAARGLLMMEQNRTAESVALFDEVLARDAEHPRALLGKGLALLAAGEPAQAAAFLDRAARRFRDHLGSWVAAGWAYYVVGDLEQSRARFETALALDDTFGETHGGLAVLDFAAGETESARKRCDVALRLDRNCFSGALAKSMLLEQDGDPASAQRIRERAMAHPLGASGRTIARALAEMAPASAGPVRDG
jgi:tetratricopeptide (TPR) repeat protein